MAITSLVVVATVCLVAALIEAWLIVGLIADPSGLLHGALKNREDLVRSHIDYLLMALFLYAFFGLCQLLSARPAGWMIAAACFGALFNPFGFLLHAIRPHFKHAAPFWFSAGMMASCVATTVGFVSIAWTIAQAAL